MIRAQPQEQQGTSQPGNRGNTTKVPPPLLRAADPAAHLDVSRTDDARGDLQPLGDKRAHTRYHLLGAAEEAKHVCRGTRLGKRTEDETETSREGRCELGKIGTLPTQQLSKRSAVNSSVSITITASQSRIAICTQYKAMQRDATRQNCQLRRTVTRTEGGVGGVALPALTAASPAVRSVRSLSAFSARHDRHRAARSSRNIVAGTLPTHSSSNHCVANRRTSRGGMVMPIAAAHSIECFDRCTCEKVRTGSIRKHAHPAVTVTS
jgi:hypothetical protein